MIATGLRQSVPYIYVKAYLLTTLISIFASRPVTSRLQYAQLEQFKRYRQIRVKILRDVAVARQRILQASKEVQEQLSKFAVTDGNKSLPASQAAVPNRAEDRGNAQKSWRLVDQVRELGIRREQATARDDKPPDEQLDERITFSRSVQDPWHQRWRRRVDELARVRRLMREDDADLRTFPELNWNATVR